LRRLDRTCTRFWRLPVRLGDNRVAGERVPPPVGPHRAPVANPRLGVSRGMNTRYEESNPRPPEDSEKKRQEAGEREQGVRTEKSKDLSSPQFTVDADADD
jgi:hypothetical protein